MPPPETTNPEGALFICRPIGRLSLLPKKKNRKSVGRKSISSYFCTVKKAQMDAIPYLNLMTSENNNNNK